MRKKGVVFRALTVIAAVSLMSWATFAEEIVPARPSLTFASEGDAELAPAPPDPLDVDEEGLFEELYIGEEDPMDPDAEPDEELSFEDGILAAIDKSSDALAAVNGKTNILLIGLDARPREKTGRSDSMILLTLDAESESVKMTSFMRDLYVEIPGHKNNRMNAAYVYGGPELLKKTIAKNFGVEVDHYVAVNFSGLASVIDQIGGLTIDVNPKYVKRINAVIQQDNKVLKINKNDGLLKGGGEQLLTGKQAQAYARYRYGTPDGDFGRTARQREVIIKAIGKVKNLSMASLVKLAVNNMDKVDTDMEISDMARLAPALFKLAETETQELRIPIDKGYTSKMISGMAVLVPNRNKNLEAIAGFLGT